VRWERERKRREPGWILAPCSRWSASRRHAAPPPPSLHPVYPCRLQFWSCTVAPPPSSRDVVLPPPTFSADWGWRK
jgi:hypothetical protein